MEDHTKDDGRHNDSLEKQSNLKKNGKTSDRNLSENDKEMESDEDSAKDLNEEKDDDVLILRKKKSQTFDDNQAADNTSATLPSCKDEMGKELRENNERICEYICNLRQQRDELVFIIEKQYEERKKLETEMERITYKLCLINKSMAQRIKTKNLYDKTILEIEDSYTKLVKDSGAILAIIKSQFEHLDGMINKTTSTDETMMTSPDDQAGGEPPGPHERVCKCHKRPTKPPKEQRSRGKAGRNCTCGTRNRQEESD